MRSVRVLLPLLAFAVVGCGDAPSRLQQQTFNSSSAAAAAIKTYDKDGDGSLNQTELVAIASIANDLAQFDLDHSKSVSQSEIQQRFDKWQAMKVALVPCSFIVKFDGKPLVDAVVTLEPEEFLRDSLIPCVGKTDASGRVSPSKTTTEGDPDAGLTGVPPGLYKVKVEHPKLEKLLKYNSETTLGLQIASDNPNLMLLEFDLKSN